MARETRNEKGIKALFINNEGGRLNRNGVYLAVAKPAEKIGLHDPNSDRMKPSTSMITSTRKSCERAIWLIYPSWGSRHGFSVICRLCFSAD